MKSKNKLVGLWIGKTGESNAWYHISPFVHSVLNEKLFVVRHKRPQRNIISPKIEFITFSPGNSKLKYLLSIFSNGFNTLRKNEIDYIVSFSLVPWGIVGWMLAILFRKKFIIGLIGSDYNEYVKKSVIGFIFKFILNNSNVITTTGSAMSLSVKKHTKHSNIDIFPHCLHEDLFYNKELKKSNFLNLISISELSENKRTIDIVLAVEKLINKGINVKLQVLGEGSQFVKIENYINEKKLGDYVSLVGYVKNINPYLKRADVFIQASLNEGLSLSLIESIGMDVIPVTTIAGSEKDIIKDRINGLFFEKKNPDDLASKLEFLSNNDNYNGILTSLKKIKGGLKQEQAIKKVTEILKKL